MSGQTGITIDPADFIKGFKDYKRLASDEAIEGMKEVVDQLLNDSVNVSPTVPKEFGDLRGDVFRDVEVSNDGIKGILVFKQDYAKDQHENTEYEHTEPGSGAKYLESKLLRFGRRYFGMIARKIRSVS